METINMNQGFEHIMSPVSYYSPPEARSPKEKPQGPLLACLGCRPRKIKVRAGEEQIADGMIESMSMVPLADE